MRAMVLTVDQRGSRTAPDLVERAVSRYADGALLPFERTAGDEMQALYTDPAAAVATVEGMFREDTWYVGLGIGTVETPLPDHVRAGRGEAFVLAREAVNRAKNAPAHVAVGGADYRSRQVETVLWLWAGVLHRRTAKGWEVADLVASGSTHQQVGDRLGITQSAVSQRAQAAGLVEADRARTLATELLAALLEED
jgi:hypothetical protein